MLSNELVKNSLEIILMKFKKSNPSDIVFSLFIFGILNLFIFSIFYIIVLMLACSFI